MNLPKIFFNTRKQTVLRHTTLPFQRIRPNLILTHLRNRPQSFPNQTTLFSINRVRSSSHQRSKRFRSTISIRKRTKQTRKLFLIRTTRLQFFSSQYSTHLDKMDYIEVVESLREVYDKDVT